MLERGNLLDGDFGVARSVKSRDDNAVCALADHIEDLVRVACLSALISGDIRYV